MKKNEICILIVDDDTNNLKVLGNTVKAEGYKAEFALNGNEAIAWLKRQIFDLILLDVMMPIMDGYELMEIIQNTKSWKNTPVIFLTAQDDIESTIKAFEMGAIDYVTKPFNNAELMARVNTQVNLKLMNDKVKHYSLELEKRNKQIIDSINYAKKIQSTILSPMDKLKEEFKDSFIFYRPKDILSGDFYWFKFIDDIFIIAVVDCTGHGVPGALMSTIGYTAINEAVIQQKIVEPGDILNYMHHFIKKLLNKKDDYDSLADGMDMAICSINKSKNKIEFSGANRPMILISDGNLNEIKGDNWSIGDLFIDPEQKYRSQSVHFNPGDQLYLFTDGYVDQFGGAKDKKFNIKKFRNLLLQNCNKTMDEQEKLVNNALKTWMQDKDQVDDITVIGLRV